MTEKDFMCFVQKYLNEEILPTMIGKGLGQYSTHEDRFHNFKQLSGLEMETKEKCLLNLVAKQIVCLYDQVREWEKQKGFPATPVFFKIIDEVIKDIIIYMFLLRGMFSEQEGIPIMRNKPKTYVYENTDKPGIMDNLSASDTFDFNLAGIRLNE